MFVQKMELNKESDYWVDSADVDIGLQIGKGAFSTVYGEWP